MSVEELFKKEAMTSQAIYVQKYDFTLFITRYGNEEIVEFYYPEVGLNVARGVDIMRDLKNGWAGPDEGISSYVNDRINISSTWATINSAQIDVIAELANDYLEAVMLHETYMEKRIKELKNEKNSNN